MAPLLPGSAGGGGQIFSGPMFSTNSVCLNPKDLFIILMVFFMNLFQIRPNVHPLGSKRTPFGYDNIKINFFSICLIRDTLKCSLILNSLILHVVSSQLHKCYYA